MKRFYFWLGIFSGLAVIITLAVAALKYASFQFNTLDLAIYSQVFWNTGHGHLFASSIQNINYLGDHVELWILPLSLLVRIFPHPLTLVVLQAIVVFGSSFLLFRLARNVLSEKMSFIAACAYLLNPVIWNMASMEFHMLIFAIPLIFWILDALQKNRWLPFLFGSCALLLVREDAAFALLGIGLFALATKSRRRFWLFAILASAIWFFISLVIVRSANPDGYKFFAYYEWLGPSPLAMLKTIVTRPWYVIVGLLHPNNILLFIACVLLLFGLPLFGGSTLLIAVPAFCQLLLGRFNPQILFGSHYLALVLPSLMFAAIHGYVRVRNKKWALIQLLRKQPKLAMLIFGVFCIYSFFVLSPVLGSIRILMRTDWGVAKDQRALIDKIPPSASVVSSYGTLPNFAMRQHLYRLSYIALGKKQFSEKPYSADPETRFVVLDLNDFTYYELQYAQENSFQDAYSDANVHLRSFLADYTLIGSAANLLLLERIQNNQPSIIETLVQRNATQELTQQQAVPMGPITLLAYSQSHAQTLSNMLLLTWRVDQKIENAKNGYAFYLKQNDQAFFEVPVGWNLFPLHASSIGEVFSMRIPIPKQFSDATTFTVQLEKRKGYAELNGLGGASATITNRKFYPGSALIALPE